MANNSGLSRRAALRKQQEQEQQSKRNRRIVAVGLGVVAVVVVTILGIVVVQAIRDNNEVSASQETPPNATAEYGITAQGTGDPGADVPHLVIYEDYQCGGCAQSEAMYGEIVGSLLDEGQITLEYRTPFFRDDQLQNDSSKKAAMAAAAADSVGKFREYHNVIFENFAGDGSGYTDQQLRVDFAEAAGITGDELTTFQQLFDDSVFDEFTTNADEYFTESGVRTTPTYMVGENRLEFYDSKEQLLIQPTDEDLLRAITEAAEAN